MVNRPSSSVVLVALRTGDHRIEANHRTRDGLAGVRVNHLSVNRTVNAHEGRRHEGEAWDAHE
jgi:hypothetical protein